MHCEYCGSEDLEKRGLSDTGKQRYVCRNCGKWGSDGGTEEVGDRYTFTDNGDTAEVFMTVDEDTLNSPEKLLKAMSVDSSVWEVYKKQIGKSTAWRKDRSVDWEVVEGKTTNGKVKDTGKIKIVPVFTVKLWLRRKTEQIRTSLVLQDFKADIKRYSLKKSPIKFAKPKSGYMYEIEMPDIHIGKLTWGEETGEDGDLKLQLGSARKVIEELLAYTTNFPIEKILFPIGNDFYNVDNQYETTTHGTPQQEDTRWRKTFRAGWNLAAEMINMCAQVAPVEVPIIGGNHDEERSFYLGEVLGGLYSNTKRVTIDNSPRLRKYVLYGENLIGLTHGYHEKIRELKDIMALEVPDLWAKSKVREWHTGDKHHKEDFVHKTHEFSSGVVVRILRSLTTTDAWHYNKGYIGALRAAEAFMWDREKGLLAQFTASPR